MTGGGGRQGVAGGHCGEEGRGGKEGVTGGGGRQGVAGGHCGEEGGGW